MKKRQWHVIISEPHNGLSSAGGSNHNVLSGKDHVMAASQDNLQSSSEQVEMVAYKLHPVFNLIVGDNGEVWSRSIGRFCKPRVNVDAYRNGRRFPPRKKFYGEQNGQSKLTKEEVFRIRSLEGKMSQTEIGKMFGVSQTLIGMIFRRKKWGHLSDNTRLVALGVELKEGGDGA